MQGSERAPGTSSPASAVKVLSMRLPKREAPHALAPQALLQSPGAAGAPAGFDPMLLQLLMRAFVSPQETPTLPGGNGPSFGDGLKRERQLPKDMPMGPFTTHPEPAPLPPPRIIPGEGGGRGPSTPEPPPAIGTNPWLNPGRNPKLGEKYGAFDPLF